MATAIGNTTCNGYVDPPVCETLKSSCNVSQFRNRFKMLTDVAFVDACANTCNSCSGDSLLFATADIAGPGQFVVAVRSVDTQRAVNGVFVERFVDIARPIDWGAAKESGDEGDGGFQTAILVSVALVFAAVIAVGSIVYLGGRKKKVEEVQHSDLETQLDQMKMGIDGLGGKVSGMFCDEFSRTIIDANQSEAEFAALEITREQVCPRTHQPARFAVQPPPLSLPVLCALFYSHG